MTGRRWPNLFIVGAAKAGTTSLSSALHVHPDIFVSPRKEPHFFSSWRTGSKGSSLTPEEYLDLFMAAANERYWGEASTTYLWHEASASAIKAVSPDARIVISLREPIARATSHFNYFVRMASENRSFLEAVASELAGREPPPHFPRYVLEGRYPMHLERYFDVFGRERVHVLFFEELIADPANVLLELQRFLSIEPIALVLPHENPYRAPRGGFGALLLSLRTRRTARRVLPLPVREFGERLLSTRKRRPPLDADVRAILDRVYEPERTRLERLLGRPLPW